VEYLWDMGDSTTESGPIVLHTYSIPNDIAEYVITLHTTSNAGCINSSSRIINVVPFVPNVFSPDGDGTNDRFMPGVELEIIDRNGLLLYKGTDGWDGTYHEQDVDPDTYFYYIRFGESTFKDVHRRGFVTLIR
jgi:gliding motility-associated-like protein